MPRAELKPAWAVCQCWASWSELMRMMSLPQGTGPMEMQTRITGLRVQSMNHYTTEASAYTIYVFKFPFLLIALCVMSIFNQLLSLILLGFKIA